MAETCCLQRADSFYVYNMSWYYVCSDEALLFAEQHSAANYKYNPASQYVYKKRIFEDVSLQVSTLNRGRRAVLSEKRMDGKEIQIINVTLIYIYGSLLRFNKISIRLCDVDTKDAHITTHRKCLGAKVQVTECDNNVEKGCSRRSALTIVCLCSTIYEHTSHMQGKSRKVTI